MTEITRILSQFESGDPSAAERLLPLVYEELRKLAAARLGRENPGQTLQATALVHEAYLRLVGGGEADHNWDDRGHFFAAAAEAMRRILVERARQKKRLKHGGGRERLTLSEIDLAEASKPDELLAVHEVLSALERTNEQAARLVKLRYFVGMTIPEAAKVLSVSPRKADQIWAYARAWLLSALEDPSAKSQ